MSFLLTLTPTRNFAWVLFSLDPFLKFDFLTGTRAPNNIMQVLEYGDYLKYLSPDCTHILALCPQRPNCIQNATCCSVNGGIYNHLVQQNMGVKCQLKQGIHVDGYLIG